MLKVIASPWQITCFWLRWAAESATAGSREHHARPEHTSGHPHFLTYRPYSDSTHADTLVPQRLPDSECSRRRHARHGRAHGIRPGEKLVSACIEAGDS